MRVSYGFLIGALILVSVPSFGADLQPCATSLSASIENLQTDLSPLKLIQFFDSLSGPNSATLRELSELAGIDEYRFSRWRQTPKIKGKTLSLPSPKMRKDYFNEDLARIYLSIVEPLRLKALRNSVSPFSTKLTEYQSRTATILAKSEFQVYDILFFLAPQLLPETQDELSGNDLTFKDRRLLTRGKLPGFVKPSLNRALDGWASADSSDPDAALNALRNNNSQNELNYLWFGDAEHRVKSRFWQGMRYAPVILGALAVYDYLPDLYVIYGMRDQITSAAAQTIVIPLTTADLADGKLQMHNFYARKIEETTRFLEQYPRSPTGQADMTYYQKRFRETES